MWTSENIVTSCVPWLIITGSGLDGGIYWHLHIHTVRDYRQLQRYRYSKHFQFTVAHALASWALTIRILATDLSQAHCHFNPKMTSSWHSLIPFLPFPAATKSEDAQFSSNYCSDSLISFVQKQKLTAGNQLARSLLASGPAGTHGHIFVQCQDLCFFPFGNPPYW
jgi:hypothetical protein